MTVAAQSLANRVRLGFYFGASETDVAFPIEHEDGVAIFHLDLKENKSRVLKSAKSHLLAPYITRDMKRLLFVRQPKSGTPHELISCELRPLDCRRIATSVGSISAVSEIPNGDIIYSGSASQTGNDNVTRFSRNDIWAVRPGESATKFFDLGFFQISGLSASREYIYLSAFGSDPKNPLLPQEDALSISISDIYRLPLREEERMDLRKKQLVPQFLSGGRSTLVSASEDDTVFAYLNADTRVSPYRYALAITRGQKAADVKIASDGLGFSRPVVVKDHVVAREIFRDRYLIRRFDGNGSHVGLVAVIDDELIRKADSIEIQIK